MADSKPRTRKCPGCKAPLEDHAWGIPSSFCEGESKSSPKKPKEEGDFAMSDDTMTSQNAAEIEEDVEEMKIRLAKLDVEERELQRRAERARLAKELETKEAAVTQLRRECLRDEPPRSKHDGTAMWTPLDTLLQSDAETPTDLQTRVASHPWMNALGPVLAGPPAPQQRQTSEMFLKPAKLTGEIKVYLIPDFVDALVPQMNEETIGSQGSARLTLNYGPKKPKLESVSMQQWVVGNTRIVYTLLEEKKLNALPEIQDYLAYTVKIMELANKYEWKSVLMYDNEFRRSRRFTTTHGASTPTICIQ